MYSRLNRMRLYFSFLMKDGKELVSRSKPFWNYKGDKCVICNCKNIGVYTFVYEHRDNDTLRTRMRYSESMKKACFIHFLDDGVDKGRKPWGQKKI